MIRQVKYGSAERTLVHSVAVQRLGTEMPDMELTASTVNDLPYAPQSVTRLRTDYAYGLYTLGFCLIFSESHEKSLIKT